MTNLEERLERTENDLELVKQLLVATARAVESNREDISQLTNRLDRLTINVDQLTGRVDQLTGRVDQLTGRVDQLSENLTASIQHLTEMMIQSVETADADRAVMREIQTEVRGLQFENRRILDHLFGQQSS